MKPRAVEVDRELLQEARTMIRDMAKGWPAKELSCSPEAIVEELSNALGEDYNFETGDVKDVEPS